MNIKESKGLQNNKISLSYNRREEKSAPTGDEIILRKVCVCVFELNVFIDGAFVVCNRMGNITAAHLLISIKYAPIRMLKYPLHHSISAST